MSRHGVVVVALLQVVCVLSMCLLTVYRPWATQVINWQHLGNEILLYVTLCVELAVTATPENEKR